MKLVLGILVIVAIAAGGFALFSRIQDLTTAVAVTKRELAAARERLGHVEKELAALQAAQLRSAASDAPEPRPASQLRLLQIGPGEAEIIREVILNQPGVGPDMNAVAQVGQTVQDVSPRPVPIELVARIPKLKGLRYVLDAHWAIALIAASADRVVAIVSPV